MKSPSFILQCQKYSPPQPRKPTDQGPPLDSPHSHKAHRAHRRPQFPSIEHERPELSPRAVPRLACTARALEKLEDEEVHQGVDAGAYGLVECDFSEGVGDRERWIRGRGFVVEFLFTRGWRLGGEGVFKEGLPGRVNLIRLV